MVTSRPRVKRYGLEHGYDSMMRRVNRMKESEDGVYVRFDDYEELQAECEELRIALAESQANDRQDMYYLNQVRGIVGGDDFPDMVERCRDLVK